MSEFIDSIRTIGVRSAEGSAIGTAALVGMTVARAHRFSHRSLGYDPGLANALDLSLGPYTDVNAWAATHIFGHHRVPDANLVPFIEIWDCAQWLESQKIDPRDVGAPEFYDGLDPVAKQISFNKVLHIGGVAAGLVEGKYRSPDRYSDKHLREVLGDRQKRYAYTDIRARAKRPTPSQYAAGYARILQDVSHFAMDTHAPALLEDGARFLDFARVMVWLYRAAEGQWDSNEELPSGFERNELQQFVFENRSTLLKLYSGMIVLSAVGLGVMGGERSISKLLQNTAIGGLVAAGSGGGLVAGGIITNYFGHLGRDPFYTARTGIVIPHEDGTLATNGNIFLALLTADEAGWQGNHHREPWLVAFAKGLHRAPVGTLLEELADRGKLGFRKGDGFGGQDRPDVTHDSVKMLEEERVRTMQAGLYPTNRQQAEAIRAA